MGEWLVTLYRNHHDPVKESHLVLQVRPDPGAASQRILVTVVRKIE
jgi:hypothetical protein